MRHHVYRNYLVLALVKELFNFAKEKVALVLLKAYMKCQLLVQLLLDIGIQSKSLC